MTSQQMQNQKRIALSDNQGKLVVDPMMGGAVVNYEFKTGQGWVPILRPGGSPQRSGFFGMGCNVLLPFANRISGGGFETPSGFLSLSPNLAGEPLPIHGNGFQVGWQVKNVLKDEICLSLQSAGPSRFRYSAQLNYVLEEGMLRIELEVGNKAEEVLPYGLGFHPSLAREEDSQLQFNATGCWLEDSEHLPTEYVSPGSGSSRDFRRWNDFRVGFLNNAYTGWDRIAELIRPQYGLHVRFTAEDPLNCLQVYSPSAEADFVCIEPVSHTVDALNNVGKPGTVSPKWLVKGGSLSVKCRIEPRLA
jgi:aldose 1-epimerase